MVRIRLLAATAILALFPHAAMPQADAARQTLATAKPEDREFAGGQTHSYRIGLTANQYLHLVVDQRGIEVPVTVLAPGGEKLIGVDSPSGDRGAESVEMVAAAAGDYSIEVRSLNQAAKAGKYEIQVVELRTATRQDHDRVTAQGGSSATSVER